LAIETYPDQLEPENHDAVIWRFLNMHKFRDFMTTEELYFCRADLFTDAREGLPPEEYLATFGLNPYDLNDRRELLNQIGSDAQFREGFYVNCWHLLSDETCQMWREYGNEGVAIVSRYQLLKSVLDAMSDRAYIGLVRYGAQHLIGKRANLFRYMTTKRTEYAHEREVRAFLWVPDPHAGINRHYDADDQVYPIPLTPPPSYVLRGQRRKVDLRTLLTGIVVSPWASSTTFGEVARLIRDSSLTISVQQSELTRYAHLLP
jgi:hypothetical protein